MDHRLLSIDEAAAILHESVDFLYRSWHTLFFAFKMGKEIRFSLKGIEQYIANQLQEKHGARPRL